MLTAAGNIHYSKLPKPGQIVRIAESLTRKIYYPAKRWIAESFPLTDSADYRFSIGVHTVNLVSVCGRFRVRIAGHWLVDEYGEPC